MLKVKKTDFIQTLVLFAAIFVVLFFSPYSADDYSLLNRLVVNPEKDLQSFLWSAIVFGNGRFLGNLELWFSVFADTFRIVAKPVFLTAIIVMTIKLFDLKNSYEKIFVAILLLFPSAGFFSKCYVNTPCFFNFVAPFVGFLLSLCIIKRYHSGEQKDLSKICACVVLLIASVCMQLHSEHSTLIFVLAAIGVCIFERYKYKKISIPAGLFFTGSVIGAAVMFLGPRIMGVESKMEGYRGLYINLPYAIGVLGKFSEMISTVVLLFVFISVLELMILAKRSSKDKYRTIHILVAVLYPVISLVYVLNMQTNEAKAVSYIKLIFLALLSLYVLNTIAIVLKFVKSTEAKYIMVVVVALAVLSVAVFTVLNQHGYRTFYLALFLVFIFAIVLFKTAIRECEIDFNEETRKYLGIVSKAAFSILIAVMSFQMIQNYDVVIMRDHYIKEKSYAQEEVIEIPKLPNKRIWLDEYIHLYKDYFETVTNGKEIQFVDIEEWELYEEYQSMQDNPIAAVTYAFTNFNFNKGAKN